MSEVFDDDQISKIIMGKSTVGETSKQTIQEVNKQVEVIKESSKNVVQKSAPIKGASGLDIGTSRIVNTSQTEDGELDSKVQLNAFFSIPYSTFALDMLDKNKMDYTKIVNEKDNDIVVLGFNALEFANIFNAEIKRPMGKGLVKPNEKNAIPCIKECINTIVPRASEIGQPICFSVPSPPIGGETDLIFHESILEKYLKSLGYKAKSINEGMAIVLSELADDNYTGIGISMGAGMCNICFSFLSVPIVIFSLSKGGDDIDKSVSRVAHETENRVRVIKEESLDFAVTPKSNLENALHIYYEDLILNLINTMKAVISQTENLPMLKNPIPIVLAGGSSSPAGFKDKFTSILQASDFPVDISEIRMAHDPLLATSRGAYIAANAM